MRTFKPIQKRIIATTLISSPLGQLFAAASEKGIVMLSYYEEHSIEKKIEILKKTFEAEVMPAQNQYFEQLSKELKEYFNKTRENFDVPMQLVGTPFQVKVWKILLAIPYASTISYKQLAELINQPTACRAVANANGKNMIPIIVPCHRVINSNGKMGGYTGGLDKKEFLLNLETK